MTSSSEKILAIERPCSHSRDASRFEPYMGVRLTVNSATPRQSISVKKSRRRRGKHEWKTTAGRRSPS
jgi:hypothetical protein